MNYHSHIKTKYINLFPEDPSYPLLRPIDSNLPNTMDINNEAEYSFQAVELLINEIGILLDRCYQAYNSKQEIEEKLIKFIFDDELFWSKDPITTEMLTAIAKDLQNKIIDEEYNLHFNTERLIGEAIDLHVEHYKKFDASPELTNKKLSSTEIAYMNAYHGEYADNVRLYSGSLVDAEAKLSKSALLATEKHYAASKYSSEKNKQISLLKKEYNERYSSAQYKLHLKERESRSKLLELATTENCALNYKERLLEIYKLFLVDISSAYSRMKALRNGLATIFNISICLPEATRHNVLFGSIQSVRDAIEQLSFVKEKEIVFNHVVKIDMSTHDTVDVDKFTLRFIVDDMYFSKFNYVRIGSISFAIEGNNGVVYDAECEVSVPSKSYYKHGESTFLVDQSNLLKICFSGLVSISIMYSDGYHLTPPPWRGSF